MECPQWCSGMQLYFVAFQVGTGQNLLISYRPGCVLLEQIVALVCSDVWFQ